MPKNNIYYYDYLELNETEKINNDDDSIDEKEKNDVKNEIIIVPDNPDE